MAALITILAAVVAFFAIWTFGYWLGWFMDTRKGRNIYGLSKWWWKN